MKVYRLFLSALALATYTTIASAATSDDAHAMPAPVAGNQATAVPAAQSRDSTERTPVTVASPAQKDNVSSLPTPEFYWWKDR